MLDGQPVVRVGVRGILNGDFEVEEAATWRDALEILTATGAFDVAVVGIDAPQARDDHLEGPAMIRALRKAMPGTAIVAHATRPARHSAGAALDAGASAYVAKSSSPEALREAIETAADAGRFVDPAARESGSRITRRQREILQLLADGLSTKAIAHRLGLSAETIRAHSKAMLARLEARDRTHAVAIGLRAGLID
ncbi:MAG: response regulator transcription factor [Actinomycetota bacterium]|nr:response regulator transcription factor [Actinomycetota bacterium]